MNCEMAACEFASVLQAASARSQFYEWLATDLPHSRRRRRGTTRHEKAPGPCVLDHLALISWEGTPVCAGADFGNDGAALVVERGASDDHVFVTDHYV